MARTFLFIAGLLFPFALLVPSAPGQQPNCFKCKMPLPAPRMPPQGEYGTTYGGGGYAYPPAGSSNYGGTPGYGGGGYAYPPAGSSNYGGTPGYGGGGYPLPPTMYYNRP